MPVVSRCCMSSPFWPWADCSVGRYPVDPGRSQPPREPGRRRGLLLQDGGRPVSNRVARRCAPPRRTVPLLSAGDQCLHGCHHAGAAEPGSPTGARTSASYGCDTDRTCATLVVVPPRARRPAEDPQASGGRDVQHQPDLPLPAGARAVRGRDARRRRAAPSGRLSGHSPTRRGATTGIRRGDPAGAQAWPDPLDRPSPGGRAARPAGRGSPGPFAGATRWLNSEPLTPEGLRGRVVLVDFWTYTCVNWLRTLPYVRAWAAKYAAAGLTVVGVHTPEFGFESDVDNVIAQSRNLGVEYPVAVDNDYPSGAPSPTASGRRCTSPMPRAASGTTTSARASTPWPRWSSNSSCSRPAQRTSTRTS